MKRISSWAHTHKKAAWLLIVAIKFILIVMACYLGIILAAAHFVLPATILYLLAATALAICFLFYPSGKNRNYAARKSFDFLLGACSFLVITAAANNLEANIAPVSRSYGSTAIGTRPATAESILSALKTGEKTTLTNKEKRILKKELFKQAKIFAVSKVSGDKEKADHSLAIILTIIGAIGLLFLLSAVVCNLSCGGSDAAAIIVGLLGLAGIIWGTVAIINSIKRGPKNKSAPKTE